MAWCCQATSHYLNWCRPGSILLYGVIRPVWNKWQCSSSVVTYQAIRQQAITWANVDSDLCRFMASPGHNELSIINTWMPEQNDHELYLGLTRSISWLLMPWLLTSPRHQQPWYWIYRICRSFSYLRKDSKYLCHNQCGGMTLNVTLKNLARKGLSFFLRAQLTKNQRFRQWVGAVQAPNHYLNQWWPHYLASLGHNVFHNPKGCFIFHLP